MKERMEKRKTMTSSGARLLDRHVYAARTWCGGKTREPHPRDPRQRSTSNALVPRSFDLSQNSLPVHFIWVR